jgi:hypothetical protein
MHIDRTFGARGETAHYDGFSTKRVMTWAIVRKRSHGGQTGPNEEHEIVGIVIHAGKIMPADEVEGFQGYKE